MSLYSVECIETSISAKRIEQLRSKEPVYNFIYDSDKELGVQVAKTTLWKKYPDKTWLHEDCFGSFVYMPNRGGTKISFPIKTFKYKCSAYGNLRFISPVLNMYLEHITRIYGRVRIWE